MESPFNMEEGARSWIVHPRVRMLAPQRPPGPERNRTLHSTRRTPRSRRRVTRDTIHRNTRQQETTRQAWGLEQAWGLLDDPLKITKKNRKPTKGAPLWNPLSPKGWGDQASAPDAPCRGKDLPFTELGPSPLGAAGPGPLLLRLSLKGDSTRGLLL